MLRNVIICYLLAGALAARKKIDSNDGKILGGHEIDITDAPYMAGLVSHGKYFCGGTIIDLEYILTAAHCVRNFTRHQFVVHVGSKYRLERGQFHNIREIIMHPGYSNITKVNDIALLRLETWITHSLKSKKIKVGTIPLSVGAPITVKGWGRVSRNGEQSKILKSARFKLEDHTKCKEYYYLKGLNVTDTMFCTVLYEEGCDPCHGDSGGPAVTQGMLVGIIIRGTCKGRLDKLSLYTRVSCFVDWIELETGLKL